MSKYLNRQSVLIVNFAVTLVAVLVLAVFRDISINTSVMIIDANGMRMLAVIMWMLVSALSLVYEGVVRMLMEKQKADNIAVLVMSASALVIIVGVIYMLLPKGQI